MNRWQGLSYKGFVKEYQRPRYRPISPDEILKIGMATKDLRARCLFFFCYLTGSRISEAAQFRSVHLSDGKPGFYQVDLLVLKKRKQRGMRRFIPIPRGERARCHENEMMGEIITYLKDFQATDYPFWCWGRGEPYTKRNGRVLERKVRPDLMDIYIRRHITLKTDAQVKSGDHWIERPMEKPMHPHFLRHCRAAHLVSHYNFTDARLQQFFKWADAKIASIYIEEGDMTSYFEGK